MTSTADPAAPTTFAAAGAEIFNACDSAQHFVTSVIPAPVSIIMFPLDALLGGELLTSESHFDTDVGSEPSGEIATAMCGCYLVVEVAAAATDLAE